MSEQRTAEQKLCHTGSSDCPCDLCSRARGGLDWAERRLREHPIEQPSSTQSPGVRAGNAFVAKFKREPTEQSDCAWLNGYAEAADEIATPRYLRPWVGTASMFAQEHKLAVTDEWCRGWNSCLDALDARGCETEPQHSEKTSVDLFDRYEPGTLFQKAESGNILAMLKNGQTVCARQRTADFVREHWGEPEKTPAAPDACEHGNTDGTCKACKLHDDAERYAKGMRNENCEHGIPRRFCTADHAAAKTSACIHDLQAEPNTLKLRYDLGNVWECKVCLERWGFQENGDAQ